MNSKACTYFNTASLFHLCNCVEKLVSDESSFNLKSPLEFIHRRLDMLSVLMRVALHHSKRLVSADPFYGRKINPSLNKMSNRGVA